MARSRHRKAHKQALVHWRTIHCAPKLAEGGTPVRVAKKAHEVRYPETPKRMATITAVTPEGWEAELEGGGILRVLGPGGVTPQKGDRFAIDYPLDTEEAGGIVRVESLPKPSGPFEEAFVGKPLRGQPHLLTMIDDAADFTPQQRASLLDVDYPELEKRALAQLLEENPGKTLEELLSKPQALSMGCTVEDHKCPEDSGRGLAEKVYGPGAQAHFEMAWHRDESGKPVFDEVSICPGPDPNGLTTL